MSHYDPSIPGEKTEGTKSSVTISMETRCESRLWKAGKRARSWRLCPLLSTVIQVMPTTTMMIIPPPPPPDVSFVVVVVLG